MQRLIKNIKKRIVLVATLLISAALVGYFALSNYSQEMVQKRNLRNRLVELVETDPTYLDREQVMGARVSSDIRSSFKTEDGVYVLAQLVEGELENGKFTGVATIRLPNGDLLSGNINTVVSDFILRDGTKTEVTLLDAGLTVLELENGNAQVIKIINGEIENGRISSVFSARTLDSGYQLAGIVERGRITEGYLVTTPTYVPPTTRTIGYILVLENEIKDSKGNVLQETTVDEGIETPEESGGQAAQSQDTQEDLTGSSLLRDLSDPKRATEFEGKIIKPNYDKGTYEIAGLEREPNLSLEIVRDLVSEAARGTREQQPLEGPSLAPPSIGEGAITSTDILNLTIQGIDIADRTITGQKLALDTVKNENIEDGAINSVKIEDNTITASDIQDGTIVTADLSDSSVTSAKIENNTVTADDLASTLTLSDGDFLDLANIAHDDSALQGLRLPNVSSATPTSPTSGEGFLAYDTSGNTVLVYDGSSWTQIGGSITLYTGSDDTTTTSSASGLELINTDELSLIRGCAADEVLKWNDTAKTWGCATDTGSSGSSLQGAYDAGNTITTSDARDIDITLADTTTDSNFDIDVAADNTVSISRLDNAVTESPTQLLLLENLDTNLTVANGLLFNVATGGVLTDAIDVSDAEITNALNIGANNIVTSSTTIASTELDLLDSGITLGELTDSGTLTASTVDINGGNIDGTVVGGTTAAAGTFTTLTANTDAILPAGSIGNAELANSSISLAGDSGSGSVSLGGTLTINGSGIASTSVSGGTYTITATEADTLATVTGRGATTTDLVNLNGGIISQGAVVGKALVRLDETGDQNILTASASGTTVFNLTRNGLLQVATSQGIDTLSSGALNIGTTNATSAVIGSGSLGSLTVTTDSTGDSEVSLPGQSIGASEVVNDSLDFAQLQDTLDLDVETTIQAASALNLLIGNNTTLKTTGTGTITANDVAADTVALTTDTTGNYVASITNGNGITGGDGGSEGAALTLAIDLDTTAADGSTTSSTSGLEFDGNGELTLIRGCGAGQILEWDDTGFDWQCADDDTGGAGVWTANGNVLHPSSTDDQVVIGGNTTTDFFLEVNGARVGKALVALNETGDQNILTASASGTTVLNLDRSGNLAIEGSISDLGGSVLTVDDDLKVGGDDIQDSGDNVILSSDGSGNIDVLGTITGTLTADGSVDFADAGADTITIGDANDTTSITGANWSVTSAGVGTFTQVGVDSLTLDSTSLTSSGVLSLTSDTTNAVTLDSGTTGAVNVGTGNNAKTINLGTGTAGNTINIATDNTTADTVSIGSALDGVSITGDDWSVTDAGVATFANITCNSTSCITLGTETDGNYVASITNGTGITGADGGSEGATLTLSVDESTNFAWTGIHSWTNTLTNTSSQADFNLTLGADADVDTISAVNIDATSAATGDADNLYGINIANLTSADATVNEYAINVGTSWDSVLRVGGTEVIDGSGQLVSTQLTGTLFTAAGDSGSGTIVQGDTLTVAGGTNITTAHSGDTITANLDDNVSLSGTTGLTLTGAGSGVTLENSETITNSTDDFVVFTGAGGTDNTDLTLDLDGTLPVLSSAADTAIGIDEDLTFIGAQTISTSDGSDLTIGTNDVNFTATGGSTGNADVDVDGYLQVGGTAEFDGAIQADGLSADTDDTVLILNTSNQVATREIDPDVWTAGTLIDGSGSAGQVTFWSDSDTVSGNNDLFWDNTAETFGIGTGGAATHKLEVTGTVTGKALAVLNDTGTDQNILSASASGTTVANLDRSGNLAIEGSISDLGGTVLTVDDDLKVGGNDIQDSGDTTRITLGATTTLTNTTTTFSGTTTINGTSVTALNLGAATVDFNGAGTLQYGDGSDFTIADDGGNNILALTGTTDLLEFGNATDNNAFTFLGTGQVTFNGNVNATSGLDVTGADLTIGGTNATITTAGAATFASTLTADGNTVLGDANTDTVTFNAGQSGTGITFSDASFQSCTALETDASGVLTCGTDDTGGSGVWTANGNVLHPSSTDDQVVIGGNTTTDFFLEVNGARVGKALTVLDETGDQNILVASASGSFRFAVQNDGDLELRSAETIGNQTDGFVDLTGLGGSNNTDLRIDLDDASGPILSSQTDTAIQIDEDLTFVGAQSVTTTTGDLTISPTADIVLDAAGSGTTGTVYVGPTSSTTTPDLIVVGRKSDAGDPTGINGSIYYDSNGKFRIFEGGSWKTICNETDAACGAGSGSAWSALSDPTGNLSLNHAEFTTSFTWNTADTAAAFDAFTLSLSNDATTDSNTQRVLVLQNNNTTGSTDTERLLVLNNADTDEAVTTALEITSDTGTIGTAIDISDSDITTGISLGANDITGTTAVIDFNNFDVSSAGNITVAIGEGLDTNAAGTLELGITNANAITLGSTGVTTTNAGALTVTETLTANGSFTLGDNGDTGSINTSDWDISTTGDMTNIGSITADGAISFTPGGTDDITFTLDADTDLVLSGAQADTDDTVLILNASDQVKTREIDPDVWTAGTLIDGSGASGQVTFWSDSDTVSGNNDLFWDNTAETFGIGTAGTNTHKLEVTGTVTGKALAVLNDTGTDQNILSASASGTTVANLDRSGNLAIEGTISDLGGTVLTVDDDLQVNGNDILDSGSTSRVTLGATTTLTNTTTTFSGTSTINGTSVTALNLGAATVDFNGAGTLQYGDGSDFTIADDGGNNILALTGTTDLLEFGNATDNNAFTFLGTGTVTTGGDIDIQGGDLTTNQTTFNLINTTATTLNLGGAATTFNIGPTGASGTIVLSGGSGDTGCTLDGTTGDWTCSGDISGASTGTVGYWTRGTGVVYPATDGDSVVVGEGQTATDFQFEVQDAVTGKALAVLDEEGDQNILVASASGAFRLAVQNDGDLELRNSETIGNQTDGSLVFSDSGGQTITFDIDATNPTLVSSTTALGLDDDLQFIGAQSITTSTGNLTIDSAGTFVISDATDINSTLDVAGDITFDATTPTISITDTETLTINDGTNTLLTLADAGTTGNLSVTGTGTFTGSLAANGGITFDNATDTVGAHTLSGTLDVNSQQLSNLGVVTGAIDAGGATSFEIPNAAAPTVDTDGEIALDTDFWGAAGDGAVIVDAGNANVALVGILTSDTCTDNQIPKFNDTTDEWTCEDDSTGGAGAWTEDTGTIYPSTLNNEVGIGTQTAGDIISKLYVTNDGSVTGKALAIFNQTESQDIFTASASGAFRLAVQNDGDLELRNSETIGNQTDGSLVFSDSGGQTLTFDLDATNVNLTASTATLTLDNDLQFVGPQTLSTSTGDLTVDSGSNTVVLASSDTTITATGLTTFTTASSLSLGSTTTLTLGSGATIATSSNGNLTLAPDGTGDIVLGIDDDTETDFTGTITNTGTALDINLTLGADADVDNIAALDIDLTSAATGDADTFYGIDLDLASADATVVEHAIDIGANWDNALVVNGVTIVNGSGAIPAGAYGAASIDGDDINSNIAGNGLVLTAASPDTLDIDLLDSSDGTGLTASFSGLEFQGTSTDEITLLQGCADGEILKWDDSTDVRWECAADDSGGAGVWTANGNVLHPSSTDDQVVIGGNNTTDFFLEVNGARVGKALAALNETGDQNILTASASGTTVFNLTRTGGLEVAIGEGIDTLTAGTLDVGVTTANAVSISRTGITTTVNGDLTISEGATVTSGGLTVSAGALAVNSDSITSDGNLTIDATSTVIIPAADTFQTDDVTSTGALTLSSDTTNAVTLDSGTTGNVNVGTNNNAKTISIGTGTAGNTINIGTDNTTADTISIGSALDSLALTEADWSITSPGVATFTQLDVDNLRLDANTFSSTTGDITVDATGDDVVSSDRFTVGTTSAGVGQFNVDGTQTGKALVILNDTGTDQNILTASASGTTVANLDRSGNLAIDGTISDLNNTTLVVDDDLQVNGGDLTTNQTTFNLINTTATTLNLGGAATTLNIADAAITGTIDIGGVTADGTTTVNIATEGTSADTISIGNSNASTTLALTGGDDWSITGAGAATFDGNTILGDANTDTVTFNAGQSGTGITFSDASFQSCTALETDASGVLTCGTDDTGGSGVWTANGNVLHPSSTDDQVVIGGNTTTDFFLEVNGARTGKALVALDETGDQAILTASASGTRRFTVENSGNLTFYQSSTIQTNDLTTQTLTFDASHYTFNANSGSTVSIIAQEAPTQPMLRINDAGFGTTDDAASGLLINFSPASDGASDTNEAISISQAHSGDSGDILKGINISSGIGASAGTLYGVQVSTITGGAGTERAYYAGSGWDAQLYLGDTSSVIRMDDGATLTFDDGTNNLLDLVDAGSFGQLGLGDPTPEGLVDIDGAVTGKALLQLNETGDQNILSASASGTTVFNLLRTGGLEVAIGEGIDTLTAGTLDVGVTTANAVSISRTGITTTVNGDMTLAEGLTVSAGGAVVSAGGLTITAGALAVNSDSITSDGTLLINATDVVQLGDGTTNYFEFSETAGPTYFGTARPTRQITLSPEFPGATLTGDGTSNTGTMTSDFCSNTVGGVPDTNTGVCNTSGDIHNYYSWTTGQGTVQDYDIWIRWRVPDNFDSFADVTDPIQVYGKRTDTTNNAVTVFVYDTGGTVENSGGTQVAGTSWTQTSVEATFAGTYTPGDYMTIRIVMAADTGGDSVQVGEISIDYKSDN